MKTKKLLVGIVCAVIGPAAFAKDVYVDNRSPAASDAATDGRGSESLPYLTIQAAIDAETTVAGDTVKVKPGVYATGGKVCGSDVILSRVVIDKAVDVVSTGGRKVTEIVGKYDPLASNGYGEGAERCVRVTSAADGKRLEGFTLRDGSTKNEGWSDGGSGGGVYVVDATHYVVGCSIVNCRAGMGGGAYNGMFIRCLFSGCSSGQSGSLSSAMRSGKAVSCVFDSNGGCATRGTTLVNCTFVNNSGTAVSGSGNAYNCLSVGATTDFEGSITQQNCVDTSSAGSKYVVMSPGSGDYRPIAGSAAIGAGESVIETLGLPTDMCGKDFDGNPLPTTGTVDVGAVQGGATPGSGRIDLASTSATYKKFVIDGHPSSAGDWLQSEAYPAQWLVHPESSTNAATSFCIGVKWRPDSSGRLVPDMDGNVGLMPPPPGSSYTATAMYSANALYVSDSGGSDDDGNGTAAHPYKTIQKAIDKASTDYVIHVAQGDYDSNYAVVGSATNRINVNKTVLIRGAGEGRSVLWGAADPTTGGDGTGAVRAFYGNSAYASIQGFTIRDSWAAGEKNTFSGLGAGSIAGGFHLADCTITNCTGGTDSLINNITAERCRFVGNEAMSAYASYLTACYFEDNAPPAKSNAGIIGFYTRVRNCTFIGKSDVPIAGALSGPTSKVRWFWNSILDTHSLIHAKNITEFYGCLFWNLGSNAGNPDSGFTISDPVYADPTRGDRRVYSFSDATICGTSESDADAYKYLSTGLDGAIQSYGNGKPVAGACFGTVTGNYAYISAANGGIAVGGGSVGGNVFDAERTITLEAANATRPCIGYAVNGVTNLFDETPSRVIDAVAAAEGLRIAAIYTSDWYVDAENGDDANRGYTPGSAWKTLAAAMTNAVFATGDTVHAAAGDYNEGELAVAGHGTKNRVMVPAGVTLVADKGPDVTFITGASAPSADARGCGAGATRCVGEGGGAVTGFTLRGGCTHTYPNGTWDDWHGGAVMRSTIEDCVVTGCGGYGTCSVSTVRRCRVAGNTGPAGGAYNCSVYDTVFDNDGGTSWIVSCSRLIGCTFGNAGTGTAAPIAVDSVTVVSNCIVLCASSFPAGVAAPGTYFAVVPTVSDGGALPSGATLSDANHLKLDENWMPVYGENVAIDALDMAWANAEGRDARGNQRVYNGFLDAGAVEYDWRGRFAARLGNRRITVAEASPETVTNAVSGIDIRDGEVSLEWPGARLSSGAQRRFTASVSGGGSLSVALNGETLATLADGESRTFSFDGAVGGVDSLRFAYDPGEAGGCATLSSFFGGSGTMLIVR